MTPTKKATSMNRAGKKSPPTTGPFGPIYSQFKGKPKAAIKHLKKVKKGECSKALYHSKIGYIDLVWGENDPVTNKGYGLKHIIGKHNKEIKQYGYSIEDFIPIVLEYADLELKRQFDNKYSLENTNVRLVVNSKFFGKRKVWLLTAFTLKKKPKKKS